MKFFSVLFLFSVFQFLCKAQQATYSSTDLDKIVQFEKKSRSIHSDDLHLANSANYNLNYLNLQIELSPSIRWVKGNVNYKFNCNEPLDFLELDLSDSIKVDSVVHPLLQQTTHQNNILRLEFSSLRSGQDSIRIFFEGQPPSTGFGSFNIDTHLLAKPVLWTLSEPYGARDWFPCKMTLTDKIDSFDADISIPKGNKAACNGLLKSIDSTGVLNIYHWQHRYPIATYLIGIAVADYEEYSDTAFTTYGHIPVLNYCYAEDKQAWQQNSQHIKNMLSLYSDLFGAYPFINEKYGHAQFKWGGGMEHQTMSFMVSIQFDLAAHEMAHQWFGDKITCNSWSDLWLNEGFATYCTGLSYQYLAPEWWNSYLEGTLQSATSQSDLSIFVEDTTNLSRLFSGSSTYSKGAYLLHMLRWELGDSLFFRGMKNYITSPTLSYSFSNHSNFIQEMEAVSGKNLSTFFTQWLFGKGFPTYEIHWSQDDDKTLRLKVNQISSNPQSIPFFKMKIPINVKSDQVDSTLVFEHTYSGQDFDVKLPFKVDSVFFDKEHWILSKDNVIRHFPDARESNFLRIFPNPFSDEITIWCNSEETKIASMQITSISGQPVYSAKFTNTEDLTKMNLSSLSQGMYVLSIKTAIKNYNFPLIKIK